MLENQIELKSRTQVVNKGTPSPLLTETPRTASKNEIDQKASETDGSLFFKSPVVNEKFSAFLENAKVLMKHKDYSLAGRLLQQACNIDSYNYEALSLLVFCLEKSGKLDEALVVCRSLIKIDYGFASVGRLGSILYKLGNDSEALEKYYEALSLLTEESDYLFEVYKNMGNIFVRQADFDAAEEFYNKAYTLDTNSDVLLVNLGTLEVQRSDFEKALYCFRKAVDLNIQNDKAWVGLAMVHNQLGDSDLAWANIVKAIDTNPVNRTAVHLAANWGVRDGKVLVAIEFLENYLGSIEQDEDMSMVLVNLFCMTGQFDKALLEIERIILWNPEQLEVKEVRKRIQQATRAV